MAAQRKYPQELRERATRMALEARRDPARARGAIKRIADQLGVHPEALRTWVRQAEIDGGDRAGTTSEDGTDRRARTGEPRTAPCQRDITNGQCVFRGGGGRPPTAMIVEYIDAHREGLGVDPICRVLSEQAGVQIAPSTYYAAKQQGPVSAA